MRRWRRERARGPGAGPDRPAGRYEGIDERLQKVEAPHKWAAITYHFLKMFSYASLFVSAIYGLIRFLETHKPF